MKVVTLAIVGFKSNLWLVALAFAGHWRSGN
jgi:hypothetical protein